MQFPPPPPPGFRFLPTDQELVGYYLLNKNRGTLIHDWLIPEVDLYGNQEPSQIYHSLGGQGEDPVFLFSKVCSKSNTDKRSKRVTLTNGTWHGENTIKAEIMCENVKASKKTFKYKTRCNSEENCAWIAYEYRLLTKDPVASGASGEEYVVYRLHKIKNARSLKKRKEIDEADAKLEYCQFSRQQELQTETELESCQFSLLQQHEQSSAGINNDSGAASMTDLISSDNFWIDINLDTLDPDFLKFTLEEPVGHAPSNTALP